ncbi:hypothetical protein [Brevundimonas phoenicis]|uniref:hypothetical protein n=1 Tax=unclassified Brevundimonas TaxID=2622653 RepID=UPI0039A2BBCA
MKTGAASILASFAATRVLATHPCLRLKSKTPHAVDCGFQSDGRRYWMGMSWDL